MLRSSGSSSWRRFPFSPPGRSRWQEGVLLQGHPRPWPFAKLRTLWVPAHKVQGTKTDSAVLAFYLAFSLGGARASCHLRHSAPDKEAVHVCVAHVGGFLVLHSCAGSARRQRPGSRQSRQPRLRRRSSKVSRHGGRLVYLWPLFRHITDGVNPVCHVSGVQSAARWAAGAACVSHPDGRSRPLSWTFFLSGLPVTPCAGGNRYAWPSAGKGVPSRQRRYGPFRPGPWRPSACRTGRRSLSASGSLRSPVRGPAKAQRPQAYTARPPPRPYPPLRFGALLV